MWVLSSMIESFLIAFPALFSIVNPIGIALIYHQVTAGNTRAERTALAWRVAAYSLGVMLVSLLAGATLIGFFGVSLSALRVAGGPVGLGNALRARTE
jgi:multiple antibiotic resistance protein